MSDIQARPKRLRSGIGILTVAVLTVAALSVFAVSCTSDEETTTTSQRQLGENLQVVKINERSNGKVVTVSPGFIIQLELQGQPSLRYFWDVLPPDPLIVRMLSGPRITRDEGEARGTYSFTGLALRLGETSLSAEYVNWKGQVQETFTVTFNVVSSAPTTTTSLEETTTTSGSTTTTAAPTTTTAAPTTTTAAPTTTTAAPTTTTSGSTTTTAAPTTTTTAAPTTTTTTQPPTTSTTKPTLPPTTSTSYIERPPYPDEPGTTYLDERNNGQIVEATAGGKVVLSLGGNPSTGYRWEIKRIDQAVLRSAGEPQFTPESDLAGAPGVYVWTFDVLKADVSTQLALVYLDPDGNIDQYFYVGIVTGAAQITPY